MVPKDHVRCIVSLPRSLGRKLEGMAIHYRVSKSAVLAMAVRKYLNRIGLDAIERRYIEQFDQILERLAPIERNERVAIESLRFLVRYMLEVYCFAFRRDVADCPLGRERFAEFAEHVHRNVASGRITLHAELEKLAASKRSAESPTPRSGHGE